MKFFCFKQISKCDTCFYIHFSRAFQKKVLTKNPLNYFSLKITKFHGDGVINESARTKINSLFRVNGNFLNFPAQHELYVYTFLVCLFVCLYQINVKLLWDLTRSQRHFVNDLIFKNLPRTKFEFKNLKIYEFAYFFWFFV